MPLPKSRHGRSGRPGIHGGDVQQALDHLRLLRPGNRMLPFADLAALPFYVLWGVAASRGNMVRGLINAVVILALILWIGTSLGPLTTELARAAGSKFGPLQYSIRFELDGPAIAILGPLYNVRAVAHVTGESVDIVDRDDAVGAAWFPRRVTPLGDAASLIGRLRARLAARLGSSLRTPSCPHATFRPSRANATARR